MNCPLQTARYCHEKCAWFNKQEGECYIITFIKENAGVRYDYSGDGNFNGQIIKEAEHTGGENSGGAGRNGEGERVKSGPE